MKVKITVEYDVEPTKELSAKEHSNMVGMLQRLTRNRVMGYCGSQVGNDYVNTGWEVTVKHIDVSPVTKT